MADGNSGFTLDSIGADSTDSGTTGDAPGIGSDANFLAFGSGDGSGSGSAERFDPSIHAGPDKRNADGSYRRKRGRKAGAGNRNSRPSDNSASVETLSRLLTIVHLGIATVTKTPELNLDQGEADSLAMASANVLEQFDIRPDPKIEAVIGLVTTAGVIYGSKVYMIKARKKEESNG